MQRGSLHDFWTHFEGFNRFNVLLVLAHSGWVQEFPQMRVGNPLHSFLLTISFPHGFGLVACAWAY